MRATIVVSGNQGSGKTRWLNQVKAALLSTAPAEAIEVTTFEANDFRGNREQHDEFTIPAAGSGTAEPDGDRETRSVQQEGCGPVPQRVRRGSDIMALFRGEIDARTYVAYATAPAGRRAAVEAALAGKSFHFDGSRVFFTGGPVSQNCKGGGGEFAKGAGVIPESATAWPTPSKTPRHEGDGVLPGGVYWCDTGGNFYYVNTGRGMGVEFYRKWAHRKHEFPQSSEEARQRQLEAASHYGKLSAAEAPAIHDCATDGHLVDPESTFSKVGTLPPEVNKTFWQAQRERLRYLREAGEPEKADARPVEGTIEQTDDGLLDFAIAQLGQAWDTLETAAEAFEQYAEHHFAKGTEESTVKALRNLRLARMCRYPIQPQPDPEETGETA